MSGWLLLDKPEGISSAQALNKIKNFINPFKIGHAGTLDPFASGLMIIGIGEATKLIDYVMHYDKSYEFSIAWGSNTDTLDPTGAITAISDYAPPLQEMNKILLSFPSNSNIMQHPPVYSAIHVNGKRAYALARQGEDFTIAARPVFLKSLNIIAHDNKETSMSLHCGKGFYVRALARDIIAKTAGCGHVSKLRRTAIGKITLPDSIKLDYLLHLLHNAAQPDDILKLIKPTGALLDDILVLHFDSAEVRALSHGQSFVLEDDNLPNQKVIVCNAADNEVVAICEIDDGCIKPRRILNTTF